MKTRMVCVVCCVALCSAFLDRVAWAEPPTDEQVARWERVLAYSQTAPAGVAKDPNERVQAREGVAALPPARALLVVRRLLTGVSYQGRAEGVHLARRMGVNAAPLLPLLIESRHGTPPVRLAALRALGAVVANDTARDRVIDVLVTYVDRGDALTLISLAALFDLDALDDFRVVDRLLPSKKFQNLIDDETLRPVAFTAAIRGELIADRDRVVAALMQSKSWRIRDAMLGGIGSMLAATDKAPPTHWMAFIKSRLSDESAAVRSRAVGLVGFAAKHGVPVASIILPALNDPDPDVRAAAYRVASDVALANGGPVANIILPALNDSDPGVRATAYHVVSGNALAKDEAITNELLRALRADDTPVQAAAAWALRSAPKGRADVRAALESLAAGPKAAGPAPTTRSCAIAALMARGVMSDAFVPFVVDSIGAWGVVRPFARELGIGRRRFDSFSFPRFMPSGEWNMDVLGTYGERLVPALLARFRSAADDAKIVWLHALGYAGQRGREALLGLELDGANRSERALVLAATDAVTPEVIDVLLKDLLAARDEDDTIFERAQAALWQIGADAVPQIIARLRLAEIPASGMWPAEADELSDLLKQVGGKARALIEAAAKDPKTGHRFQYVLENLK